MQVYWPIECVLLTTHIFNQTWNLRLYVQVMAIGIIIIISKNPVHHANKVPSKG